MAKRAKQNSDGAARSLVIKPPNFKTAVFTIVGTAPYVQNKFSQKAREQMHDTQAGAQKRKRKDKDPKDFQACYEAAMHRCDGWCGIPASGMRAGLVSACRVAGFAMTQAKLSIFIETDGVDPDDGTPLVRITKGKPRYTELAVRLPKGETDLRPRPMWDVGWEAKVSVRFDADQFTLEDVANLLMRLGQQVGIGEGRPDSKKSCGMGWGLFTIKGKPDEAVAAK